MSHYDISLFFFKTYRVGTRRWSLSWGIESTTKQWNTSIDVRCHVMLLIMKPFQSPVFGPFIFVCKWKIINKTTGAEMGMYHLRFMEGRINHSMYEKQKYMWQWTFRYSQICWMGAVYGYCNTIVFEEVSQKPSSEDSHLLLLMLLWLYYLIP